MALLKWLLWPLLLLLAILLSLKYGATAASWLDVYHSLGSEPQGQALIIAEYRLPRVLIAMVVGVHFGLAGLIMQIVLRNPLADPTIFGISGGASLAVVAAMAISLSVVPSEHTVNASTSFIPLLWLPYIALLGGLLATALVFLLSYKRGFSGSRMTLNGVIVGAILSALVMALVLSLAEGATELAILWLAGSLYGRSLEHLLPILPWTAIAVGLTLAQGRRLGLLRFDSASSRSLGLNISLAQPLLVLLAAVLASSAVAVSGPIGFVGLLVPHMARLIGRHSIALQLWLCVFLGALLVLVADSLGRIVAAPREIPVGVLTSIVGAPVFAFILNRRARKL